MAADTHAGRVDIARLRVVDRAIAALAIPVPVYTYSVARFVEVCCQHSETARVIARGGAGTRALVELFIKNYRVGLLPLCSIALRALRHLLRKCDPEHRPDVLADIGMFFSAVFCWKLGS